MTVSAEEKAFFIQHGARIAMLRKAVDIIQVELAEELNVSQQAMQS